MPGCDNAPPAASGRKERHRPVGMLRRLFVLAAIAGIAVVVAKKLGIMGGDDEPIEFASDSGFADSSADGDLADGGEDHAAD